MDHADTKKKILDCAEALFAPHGFRGTSLRRITSAAGVNLAAVHYHFGSKDGLIEAVFKRRMEPLNAERIKALHELRSRAGYGVEQVVRAFVEPTVRFSEQDQGSRNFVALIGRALIEPDEGLRQMFYRLVAPLFRLLLDMLCEALPRLERDQLFWRLNFALGSLSRYLCLAGQLPAVAEAMELENPALPPSDWLVDFIVHGIEAP